MYTRTHILKIVNKVSKDSFRLFFINYKNTLFKDDFLDTADKILA